MRRADISSQLQSLERRAAPTPCSHDDPCTTHPLLHRADISSQLQSLERCAATPPAHADDPCTTPPTPPYTIPHRADISSQLQSLERCAGDVEEQLDIWQQARDQQGTKDPTKPFAATTTAAANTTGTGLPGLNGRGGGAAVGAQSVGAGVGRASPLVSPLLGGGKPGSSPAPRSLASGPAPGLMAPPGPLGVSGGGAGARGSRPGGGLSARTPATVIYDTISLQVGLWGLRGEDGQGMGASGERGFRGKIGRGALDTCHRHL